jgi:hypothetical protein
MNDERLTRDQERSMLDLLEQAALHDYPNPERIGCPGSDFLRRLATDRQSIDINDPALTHVARCSPCFREFVTYRDAARRKVFTRRAALAAGGAAAAGMALAAVKWSRPQNSEAYERAEINLFNETGTRGTATHPQSPSPKPMLPRKRLDLFITLPFASPEGHYEVQVLHADGKPTGLSSSGTAHLSEGKTMLRVRMNLSSLEPDAYQIGIRRIPFDWVPVPVEVK